MYQLFLLYVHAQAAFEEEEIKENFAKIKVRVGAITPLEFSKKGLITNRKSVHKLLHCEK